MNLALYIMYEYLTGLIRVLEKRLPDKTDIDRMVLAKTTKDAFDVLNDTDFADNLLDRQPEDYQKVLDDDLAQLKKLLANTIGQTALFDLLFIQFDFLNIKIALKQKLLNIDKNQNQKFSKFSLTPFEKIKKKIDLKYQLIKQKKEDYRQLEIFSTIDKIKKIDLEQNLKSSLIKIINKLNKEKSITPNIIDTICDKELLNFKSLLAIDIKNNFMRDLVKLQIDFLNTKILLRQSSQAQGKKLKLKNKDLLSHGRIDKNRLIHLYKADQPILYTDLAELFEWYEISHVINDFKEHQNIWQLEKDLNQFEYDFVHTKAKTASSGPEVISAYFFAKMNGMRNVRIIMSGKLNDIPVEDIKARVII